MNVSAVKKIVIRFQSQNGLILTYIINELNLLIPKFQSQNGLILTNLKT